MNTIESRSLDFLQYIESLNTSGSNPTTESSRQLLSLATQQSFDSIGTPSLSTIPIYVQRHPLLRHPWLLAFSTALLSRSTLITWLHQRYLISWCFPNWLMSVVAKLPSAEVRIPLLTNLYEEHGLGQSHGGKPHPQMWQQLFEELGAIAPGAPLPLPESAAALSRGTQLYLQLYTTACFYSPVLLGLGAITFVEFILPYENLLILQGLRQLGISAAGREFFEVHCECDEAHANALLGVIEKLAHTSAAIEQIWQGIRLAENARQSFYDALVTEVELVEAVA